MNWRSIALVVVLGEITSAVLAPALARPQPKLQGILAQMVKLRGEGAPGGFRARRGMLRRNRAGRVQAYVFVTEAAAAKLDALKAAGLEVEVVDPVNNVVQGWIDSGLAGRLADLPFVRRVREPDYLHTNVGLWKSEGDTVLRADLLRQQAGVDGSGVKVGVISDGVFGLLEAVATGDLPAGEKVCGNSGSPTQMSGVGIECRSFRSDGDITGGGDGSGVGAEGTALLEIVHDLAPGAELFFANAATALDLGRAQDWLADTAGAEIIIDDLAAFNVGPYDGTSSISEKTSSQVAKGKVYVNAVGNYGNSHYVGWFTDLDGDGLHEFDASLGLPGSDGAGETLDVSVPARGGVTIYVSWNEPFGLASHDCSVSLVFPADCVECDLKDTLGFNPCSENAQGGAGDPVEVCGIAREETPADVGLVVSGCSGVELQVFITGEGSPQEFLVPDRSVPNNSDARDVISAGAVGIVGDGIGGSPLLVRSYSSRGPTDDGRMKPAVSAADGVTISGAGGFGVGVGGSTRFFGTSAAVPHVAGVAALLKELDPEATPTCIAEKLAAAVDLGVMGPDSTYGAGAVDAILASAAACSPGACDGVCCDLDGDCAACGAADCLAVLEIAGGSREYDCRADLATSGGGADGVDLLDAVLCLRHQAGQGAVSGCACEIGGPVSPGTPGQGCPAFTIDQTADGTSCRWIGPWADSSPLLEGVSVSDGASILLLFEDVTPAMALRGEVTSGETATLEAIAGDLDESGEFEEGEFLAAEGDFSLTENGARLVVTQAGGTQLSIDGIAFQQYQGAFQGFSTAGQQQESERRTSLRSGIEVFRSREGGLAPSTLRVERAFPSPAPQGRRNRRARPPGAQRLH